MSPKSTSTEPGVRRVDVGWDRVEGWISRFETRHAGTVWEFGPQEVSARSPDGTRARFDVPFSDDSSGPQSLEQLVVHLRHPRQLGVVLVRRGGFAIAHVAGAEIGETKVGQRHVQSRSKAGGWSQQRFARRRDNQAAQAFDAAAEHARRILLPHVRELDLLGVGGDRAALTHVLAHSRLGSLADVQQRWLDGVPDPRREVLMAVVERLRSVTMEITDP